MFTDARSIAADSILRADICIIGAGIAGITIAREFIGRPESVVVLEGGGLEFTKSLRDLPTVLRRHTLGDQALASGCNAGQPYYPLRFTRVRAFGGSSRAWHEHRGVHARPLDAIDFGTRDGLPEHGWPIDREELDPFYERAQQVCALGPFAYDAKTWEAQGYGAPLPLDPKLVESVIFQFGKRSRFDRYEHDFARAENVNLMLHATAVHLADSGGRVVRADCATLSGNRFGVRARTFVVAVGAIETARLLLVSRDSQPAGIGNGRDLVGRSFMEHPDAAVGYLIPDPELDRSAFRLYEHQRIGEHVMVEAMFRLSDCALRTERLLNSVLRLRPTYHSGTLEAVRSAQVVRRSVHYGVATPGLAKHALRAIFGAPQVLRHYATWRSGRPPEVFGIDVMAEQAPTMVSRVTLGRRRDRLGVPMTILDWRLTSVDWDSIRRTMEIFGEAVRKAGVGTVISTVGKHSPAVFGNWHHLGTTRMHRDPARGVVDENCRVHEMTNLYIAGGSVFPTGGYANPSLTIVALSLRLADHLRSAPN
ncbi:putative FAD dependent oxidoreductase [Bradyrhizobium sp. STM 3843]|uniref:GMC oxidoreductase n=1 Tax=Bradyrhizobium sp. STM 3843 TaxID=551947 RepID=UPI000240AADE|nr:GMC family oxidoreductase [Bradyrhizobium sp. STM 3843]CCE05605.1 putative FAD dependent oxidoreductase [Bradyrhizobium sp. STM 3843]